MRDVLLLPDDQGCVDDGVHREMDVAAGEPGGGVVDAAQRGESERAGVNTKLQRLAVSALEHREVHGHMDEESNLRSRYLRAKNGRLPDKQRHRILCGVVFYGLLFQSRRLQAA